MKKALSGLVTFLVIGLAVLYNAYEAKTWWKQHTKSFTHFALGLVGIEIGGEMKPEARYRSLMESTTGGLGKAAQEWVSLRKSNPSSVEDFVRNVLWIRASVAEVETELAKLKTANDFAKAHESELARDDVSKALIQGMYQVEGKYRTAVSLQKKQIEIIREWSNDFTAPHRDISASQAKLLTDLDTQINSELFDIVVLLRSAQMKAEESSIK